MTITYRVQGEVTSCHGNEGHYFQVDMRSGLMGQHDNGND
jgi:hypothetical protein